jgi:hypothetical protein
MKQRSYIERLDYFAAKAMNSIAADDSMSYQLIAKISYNIAKAMMEERGRILEEMQKELNKEPKTLSAPEESAPVIAAPTYSERQVENFLKMVRGSEKNVSLTRAELCQNYNINGVTIRFEKGVHGGYFITISKDNNYRYATKEECEGLIPNEN